MDNKTDNKTDKKSSVNIKTVIMIGAAYTSYLIGAGFATGQEGLQYFASFGSPIFYFTVLVCFLAMCYTIASSFHAGMSQQFEKGSDVYAYYCGKKIGYFFDAFTLILVLPIFVTMFAGSGATIEQYFGVPQWVGAICMAIATGAVVFFGLKSVQRVLGFIGILIVVYVIAIGVIAMAKFGFDLSDATEKLPGYIADGSVLQANILGVTNWVFSGLNYAGVCVIVSIPFMASIGRGTSNIKESTASGITASVMFNIGMLLVSFAILLNLDYIAGIGAQVPMLAAMQNMMPSFAWSFAIILVLGIFTTITGYLWLLSGRYAVEKSKRHRIIVVVLVVIGAFGGSYLPFGQLVNIIFPIAGIVGLLLMVFMIVKDVRTYSAKRVEKAADVQ